MKTRHVKIDRAAIIAMKARVKLSAVVRGEGITLIEEAGQLKGQCPFHADDTPSLFVNDEKDGGVFRCHGCGVGGDVLQWLQKREAITFKEALEKLSALSGLPLVAQERTKVAEYVYRDAKGEELYSIERYEPGKEGRSKDFVQRLADGKPGKSPVQVPYNLHRFHEAPDATIFVVEGEKCADALTAAGLLATTHAGGASAKKTWNAHFAEHFAGRHVVLLPDNDEPGQALMAHVQKVLPHAVTLQLPLRGKGADVADWLAEGHTVAELLALVEKSRELKADMRERGLRYGKAVAAGVFGGWELELLCTRTKEIRTTIGNTMIVLENNPAFAGALFFDERSLQPCAKRALPWDRPGLTYPRHLHDDDAVFFARFMERTYEAAFSAEICGRALWAHAGLDRQDSLKSYLGGLTWDKKERTDTWLIKHAGAPDTPFVRAASRCWLISAVARALTPGCKVDHVLILEGGQGLKKSTLLAALAGETYFTDHIPDVDSKDTAMILGRSWIIELAELESMRKSEVTQLKAFITRRSDIFRPPYGRAVIEVPRRCVFAASTNEESYLRDPTGNRRFWPVPVTNSDVAGLGEVRDQLWAEAVELFRTGEKWHLEDQALIGAAQEEQAAREQVDPWTDLVIHSVDGLSHTTTGDVLHAIGVEKSRRSVTDSQRIAHILRQLKWSRHQVRIGGQKTWRFYPPGAYHPPPTPDVAETGLVAGVGGGGFSTSATNATNATNEFPMNGQGAGDDQEELPWGGH